METFWSTGDILLQEFQNFKNLQTCSDAKEYNPVIDLEGGGAYCHLGNNDNEKHVANDESKYMSRNGIKKTSDINSNEQSIAGQHKSNQYKRTK